LKHTDDKLAAIFVIYFYNNLQSNVMP